MHSVRVSFVLSGLIVSYRGIGFGYINNSFQNIFYNVCNPIACDSFRIYNYIFSFLCFCFCLVEQNDLRSTYRVCNCNVCNPLQMGVLAVTQILIPNFTPLMQFINIADFSLKLMIDFLICQVAVYFIMYAIRLVLQFKSLKTYTYIVCNTELDKVADRNMLPFSLRSSSALGINISENMFMDMYAGEQLAPFIMAAVKTDFCRHTLSLKRKPPYT